MVLRTSGFLVSVFLAFALLSGCIGAQQVVRTKTQTPVVAVYLMQFPDRADIADVPTTFQTRVADEVARRNLKVQPAPLAPFADNFRARRATDQRLKLIAGQYPGQTLMLVETEVRFYTYLSGKYRWNVNGRVTFVQPDGVQQSSPFELASFLDYDHQKESEALQYVEVALAERVGQAADRFLAGMEPSQVEIPR